MSTIKNPQNTPTVDEVVAATLDGLEADESLTVRLPDGGRLSLDVVAVDRLAIELNELRLEHPVAGEPSRERTAKVAESMEQKLTYLMEPLAVVEVEAADALLRSRTLSPGGQGSEYYELRLADGCGQVSMQRFAATAGKPRVQTSMTITRQALGRLIGDLSDATASIR